MLSIRETIDLTGPNKKLLLPTLILILLSSLFEAVSLGLFVPLIADIIGSESYIGEDSFLSNLTNYVVRFSPSEEMELAILCVFLLLVFILKNIFVFIRIIMGVYLANRLRAYWSSEIFKSLIKSNIKNIVLNKQGKLINNIVNEPVVSAKYINNIISISSRILVTSVLILIMLTLSWELTLLISVSSSILFFTYLITINSVVSDLGKKRLSLLQKITSATQENLNAIRQVKIFLIEKVTINKFVQRYDNLLKTLMKIAVFRNISLPMAEVGIIVCLVGALIYLNYFTNSNLESYLPLLAFVVIASQKIALNIGSVASERIVVVSQQASINTIYELIKSKKAKCEDDKGLDPEINLDGDILFENVSFKYEKSKENMTLDSINLRIKKGEITAITGSSGSGKSTIVDLICCLFRDYDGKILFGSRNLSNCSPSSIRSRIGYIGQDNFLFDTTIKENILIANPSLTDKEIKHFCKKANADDFINKLDEKYETELIDRGQNISGGQRQRLTIARAFASNFDLLIIDEGFSALNSLAIEPIVNYLLELKRQGKTIVMISHNKEHLSIADQLISISSGRIE